MAKSLKDAVLWARALEEAIALRGPTRMAKRVTAELQDAGPAWTGTFRNAWRILPGNQNPPGTIKRPGTYQRGDRAAPAPVIRQETPPVGAGTRTAAFFLKDRVVFTIANIAEHRLIAMDLVPGRNPPVTAPRDWFERYMKGGGFDKVINTELARAIQEARR